MTSLMKEGRTIDDIVINATGDKDIETVFESKAELHCDCSLQRIQNTIIALGKEEALKIVKENGILEISCNFCNKKYSFNEEQILDLFNK